MKIEKLTVEGLMAESAAKLEKRIAAYAKEHGLTLPEAKRYFFAFALARKSSLLSDRNKRKKSGKAKPKAKAQKSAKAKAKPAKKASAKKASKTAKRAKPAKKAKAKAAPKAKAKKSAKPRAPKAKTAPNGAASDASSLGDQIAAPLES